MIDTDKYEGHQVSEFKKAVAGPNHSWLTHHHEHGAKDAMFVTHATAALVTDAPLLLEEVERLREVAYSKDMQVGERNNEIKRLREGIEEALEAMSCHTNHRIYNSSWNILKELIE